MNTERENNHAIDKPAYDAPRTERVQVATEGGFAASQGVTDNSPSGWLEQGRRRGFRYLERSVTNLLIFKVRYDETN